MLTRLTLFRTRALSPNPYTPEVFQNCRLNSQDSAKNSEAKTSHFGGEVQPPPTSGAEDFFLLSPFINALTCFNLYVRLSIVFIHAIIFSPEMKIFLIFP